MKSAASHFLTMPHSQNDIADAASGDDWSKKIMVACTRRCVQDNAVPCQMRTSFHRTSTAPRPVFIGPLLRTPRISEVAVLLDGFPCEAVCFSGRVVRCEGPERNGSASATRPYTAMLISDTTGIIPVMQFKTAAKISAAAAASSSVSFDVFDSVGGGDSSSTAVDERAVPSTDAAFAFVAGDADDGAVYENDYVFVAGRIAFAETSKETQRVVQGSVDFVSGDVPNSTLEGRFCVRGTVRVITDMNEIHYWALSALETHVRLLSKARLGPQAFHTARRPS